MRLCDLFVCVTQTQLKKQISHNLNTVPPGVGWGGGGGARSFPPVSVYLFLLPSDSDERLHNLNLCRVSAGLKYVGVILIGQTG